MKDDNFRLSTRFLEHHPITSPLTNQKEVCTHGKITQNLTPSPDALCAQPVQLCDPMDCSPPGSSVHGIILTRVLEWVAISSSRGSSQLSDLVGVSSHSYVGRQILYHWPPGKPTRLTVINVSFLPLKTYVVKQNLGRCFLDMSLLSPQVISFLNNKANFPFLPTLLSQVLAFKRCVTEPEFSNSTSYSPGFRYLTKGMGHTWLVLFTLQNIGSHHGIGHVSVDCFHVAPISYAPISFT